MSCTVSLQSGREGNGLAKCGDPDSIAPIWENVIYLFLFICLFIFIYLYLFIFIYLFLFIYLFIYLFILFIYLYLFIYIYYIYLFLFIYVYLFIFIYLFLFIYLYIYLSTYLSIYLSSHLFMLRKLSYDQECLWIPAGVIGIFHWHNPSCRTMALRSTQPLTEMSTRVSLWGKGGRCVELTTSPP